MKKLLLLFLTIFCCSYSSSYAQPPISEKCGSDILHDRLLQNNPIYKQNFEDISRRVKTIIATPRVGRAPLLTIPVVVHVMHLGEPVGSGTNISYEQILVAIESLNNAYRNRAPYTGVDMEIEFCLASRDPAGNATNGVNRIDASGTSTYGTDGLVVTGAGNNEVAIKNLSRWSNNDYYNIWTVSEIDNNNGGAGIQGFAYFPGASANVDGTVILSNVFGYDPTQTRCLNLKGSSLHNATLIHEMGHAFGLFHTFRGDANGTACPANGNCTLDGDEICDTPPHERTNSTCPTGTTNLCGTPRDNHIHNFMEYSSDPCLTEFTAGQKTRARAFINGGRSSLLTSQACNPPSVPTSDFTSECASNNVSGCTGTAVQFYDLSTQNPTAWSWTFLGGTPNTSTAQNPAITYNTPGTYAVTLQASNSVGAGSTETKTAYITIFAPPTAASCTNSITNPGNFGHSISNVSFGDINNATPTTTNGYDDFSCAATTCVTEGQTYTLSIDVQAGNSTQGAAYRVYIDYNDNGDLSDAGEEIANGNIPAASGTVNRTHNITLPTNATENTLLRMRVVHDQVSVSGPCENLFTGSAEDYGIYIATAATINTQPTNQTNCAGGNATFSIATTGGQTFQWQENTGSGFTDITNGGIYSGTNTNTLTLTGIAAPMDGNLYRCIVGNGCDQTINSTNASLTISGGATITTQPTNQADCAGSTVNFTVAATGSPAFQWQENTGSGFVDITNGGIYSGATSSSLTLTGITNPMDGNLYRCVVGNAPCDANSNNASLTVSNGINITTNLSDTTRSCEGVNFSLNVVATGASSFQWFEFDGSTWSSLSNGGIYSGVNTNTLTFSNPTGIHNYQYYCELTHPTCGTINSDTTVNINVIFTSQPTSQAAISGNTINLIATNQHETCGAIWEVNTGSSWIALAPNPAVYPNGIDQNTLAIVMDASLDGNLYRKAACGLGCTIFSDSAEISLIQASTVRDNMYQLDGIDDHIAIANPPLGINNNLDISYTFEAWVNPTNATTRQCIIGNNNYGGTAGTALDLIGGNARFMKREGTDAVSSPITDSEWSHLAGTYDANTDEMRLYINGVLAGSTVSTAADAGGIHHIGSHAGENNQPLSDFYDGKIDEVRIWDYARTQTEIRENMHLSLSPTATGLVAYYQFDRDKAAGVEHGVRDATGLHHATAQLAAGARIPSEVHVGGGSSNTQNVVATGNVVFTGTDLEIDFAGVAPAGEVVVTHVRTENAYNPPVNAPLETGYWIVNNFGTNAGLNATTRFNYSDGIVTSTLLTDYTLYKRPSRAIGAWPQLISPASNASTAAGNNHVNFNGLNSFSNLVPTQTNTLLFNNFLTFEAAPTPLKTILLDWELESEKEVDFYEIEKSLDGIQWETIGKIQAKTNTNSYQFEDVQPNNGYNYYRIKQVYINQQVYYSWTRVVELIQEQGMWIYPNPNQGVFTIDFEQSDAYQIEIFDAIGQRIFQTSFTGNKNLIQLDVQATGIYTIKVSTDNNSYYSRLVIKP